MVPLCNIHAHPWQEPGAGAPDTEGLEPKNKEGPGTKLVDSQLRAPGGGGKETGLASELHWSGPLTRGEGSFCSGKKRALRLEESNGQAPAEM